ncbi:MAG: serine/threonine-protein kinase [Pirellulales bacterium]
MSAEFDSPLTTATMTHDRNMLFGILALQMDFIDRDQLVAAMNAWVLDKKKPLAEVLQEQQALADDERQLLDALVDKHLAKHGGDAEKSLRSLSSLGSAREVIEQSISDAAVQATLSIVSADRSDSSDPYATESFSVGESSSAGTRFKVLRPHAKGGLGQVAVALDEELSREVALKQIQDQYADGRPFYAMRFIRGDSLKDAIERFHDPQTKQSHDASTRSLELRKLLGRLIDVCNAIGYAHSRGVLHRDLKPGNVMLGKYGETLVVDWGLAKAVGRDEVERSESDEPTLQPASASGSAPTQMGSAIGTPAYMSPEQAAGRLDQLGPASDVYSLGATLYTLLTGQAPFEGNDYGEVLRKVQQGQFPKPRQIDAKIPAALEAICLKAMATDPGQRYASTESMAEDLEAWLADEPVTAHFESLAERFSRFARRHRSYLRAAAVALVLVTGVSIAATIGINQARQREAFERTRANESAEKEKQARDLAEQNLKRAREAEQLAKSEAAQQFSDFLVGMLQETDPFRVVRGRAANIQADDAAGTIRGFLDRGLDKAESDLKSQPLAQARLLNAIGTGIPQLRKSESSSWTC